MIQKYSKAFVAIHWVHAVMIAFVLIGATLTLPDMPQKGTDLTPFKGHLIFGFAVTFVTIVRLWTLRTQPTLPKLNMSNIRNTIVAWNHRLIYIVLLIVGFSGVATAKSANVGQVLIFGKDASVYTGPDGITSIFASIHGISTTLMIILIGMHIVGVISYMIKNKDSLLSRMWF